MEELLLICRREGKPLLTLVKSFDKLHICLINDANHKRDVNGIRKLKKRFLGDAKYKDFPQKEANSLDIDVYEEKYDSRPLINTDDDDSKISTPLCIITVHGTYRHRHQRHQNRIHTNERVPC